MHRHFSSRGEALAEVTAARVLARRKAPAKATFTIRAGRQLIPERWFSEPVKTTPRPKRKQPKQNGDLTTFL